MCSTVDRAPKLGIEGSNPPTLLQINMEVERGP